MEHTDVQNAVADPSPAAIQAPEAIDLSTLSHQERQTWRESGKFPGDKTSAVKPEKAEAAAAKTGKEANSDATDKGAETASDSEAEKAQEQGKGKGAEARIRQLVAEKKDLERRLSEREAAKTETKEPPTAAPEKTVNPAKLEAPVKPVRPDQNDPKFKTWEDYEKAERQYQLEHDDYVEKVADYKAKKAVEEDRAARAQEESQKTLAAEMVEVKKRYPDFEEKAVPALKKFFDDPEVPDFIKGTVGSSDVKHDLIYTLGDPETWAKIVDASKTDPRKALKAIFAAEDAIAAELSGKKSEGTDTDKTRDESGKFTSQKAPDKPVTRVTKPPSEVGGRGTDTEEQTVSAARAGDFRTFKAAADREYAERHK
jgi:hypothetical protein